MRRGASAGPGSLPHHGRLEHLGAQGAGVPHGILPLRAGGERAAELLLRHEAAYPLLCLARATGKEEYLDAAKRLFAWGENMVCEDGSVLNDGQSEWRGITVFSAVSMLHALTHHGALLSPSEKAQWKERLSKQLTWIKNSIDPDIRPFNINYILK